MQTFFIILMFFIYQIHFSIFLPTSYMIYCKQTQLLYGVISLAASKGVQIAYKKNGEIYYKSSITYRNKHISLGSYQDLEQAQEAYREAVSILTIHHTKVLDHTDKSVLSFEKWVILHNFRDTGYYIGNPIYMYRSYFSYFLNEHIELKFDTEDLFFYAAHKIHLRNGYLFYYDHGEQRNVLARYRIRNFAVEGKDYCFKNGDHYDFRHHNIEVIHPYIGVNKETRKGKLVYTARIHLDSTQVIGSYPTEIEAAVAYNKAVDLLLIHQKQNRSFEKNYIPELNEEAYTALYKKIKISHNLLQPAMQKRPMGRNGYTGVFRQDSGYRASFGYKGKTIYLGMYATEKLAAQAYNQAVLFLYGKEGRLNHVLPTVNLSDRGKILTKIQRVFPDFQPD